MNSGTTIPKIHFLQAVEGTKKSEDNPDGSVLRTLKSWLGHNYKSYTFAEIDKVRKLAVAEGLVVQNGYHHYITALGQQAMQHHLKAAMAEASLV